MATFIDQMAFCLSFEPKFRSFKKSRVVHRYSTEQPDTFIAMATEQGIVSSRDDDDVLLTVPTPFTERPPQPQSDAEKLLMDFFFGTDGFMGLSEFIYLYGEVDKRFDVSGEFRFRKKGLTAVDRILLKEKGWAVIGENRDPKLDSIENQHPIFQKVIDLFSDISVYHRIGAPDGWSSSNYFGKTIYIGDIFSDLDDVFMEQVQLLKDSYMYQSKIHGLVCRTSYEEDLNRFVAHMSGAVLKFGSGAKISRERREGQGGYFEYIKTDASHYLRYYELMCLVRSPDDLKYIHGEGFLDEFFSLGSGSVKLDASVEAVIRSALGATIHDGSYGKIHHWIEGLTVKARLEPGPLEWDLPGRITKSAIKKLVDQIKTSIKQHYVEGA